MWIFRSFLILIIILVIVAFAMHNTGPGQTVDINLVLAKRYNVPVITVVFWGFILGAAVAWLLFVSVYLRLSNQLHKAQKAAKGLETEVSALRNRPIEESKNLLDQGGLRE